MWHPSTLNLYVLGSGFNMAHHMFPQTFVSRPPVTYCCSQAGKIPEYIAPSRYKTPDVTNLCLSKKLFSSVVRLFSRPTKSEVSSFAKDNCGTRRKTSQHFLFFYFCIGLSIRLSIYRLIDGHTNTTSAVLQMQYLVFSWFFFFFQFWVVLVANCLLHCAHKLQVFFTEPHVISSHLCLCDIQPVLHCLQT